MSHKITKFSNLDRKERISNVAEDHYDIIIIGGGVTGAGIALDASLRGLKTILLEKNDFASGTSSKSTKLIHGGLRYLKQLEIGLVRETGLERSIAHNNACHLVHPEHMLLPIIKGGTFSKFSASIAIGVYDWLAKVPESDKKRTLSKKQVLDEEPLLKKGTTKSGILYSEYRTDDARLTIEIIKDARRHGAEAFNYAKVNAFTYADGRIDGVVCHDALLNQENKISGDVVVNATGPWVDEVRKQDKIDSESNLHLTKGVHIVVSQADLPLVHSTYFDAVDGRMIFAIPRDNIVYIGTTDTDFVNEKDDLTCTLADATYLLESINAYFNISPLTVENIKSSWAGLRPLIQQKGKPPTELSRKDEIFVSENGLISIAGGKLTGYRKMAERIVDLVYEKLDKNLVSSNTKSHKITRAPYNNYKEFLRHVTQLDERYRYNGMTRNDIYSLTSTYGKEAEMILANAKLDGTESEEMRKKKVIQSQIDFTIEYESLAYPIDFIERRTGWLYFDIDTAKSYLNFVVDYLAVKFKYTPENKVKLYNSTASLIRQNSLQDLKMEKVIA